MKRLATPTLLLSLVACAGPASTTNARFAVLPVAWETAPRGGELDERDAIVEGLAAADSLTVLRPDPEPPCASSDDGCARAIGRRHDASRVVSTSLAALGPTVLARVTVLDVADGTRDETHQAVLREASTAQLRAALIELGRRLAAPYLSPETAWYEEGWFWGVAAGLVLGGAVAIGVGVVLDQDLPDHVIVPP